MITKVVSGGQTGADQGGLRAAYELGIETGGWAPQGWQTSIGPQPQLGSFYGLQEHPRRGYASRTYANAKDSDGTIRLAVNFQSKGEMCTLKAIRQYDRPYIDVDLNNPLPFFNVVNWITANQIRILNVAGNSNRTGQLDIFQMVYYYMYNVFRLCM